MRKAAAIASLAFLLANPAAAQVDAPPTQASVLAAATADEWQAIAPEDVLVMDLAADNDGNARRVVLQLMPAPISEPWTTNIRTLARAHWYDGIAVVRVQDNYVVQWGDPNNDNPEASGPAKPLPDGLLPTSEDDYMVTTLHDYGVGSVVQFHRGWTDIAAYGREQGYDTPKYIQFTTPIAGRDAYAGFVSFYEGFPIAGLVYPDALFNWPVHCYGMVGVGRSYSPDAGTGAELYTVIGHAPRHLDRNIALVGRVIEGIEHLSSLPRGKGELGFYQTEEERVPITSVRLASDLPEAERPQFEYLATDSASFGAYVQARSNRQDDFFIRPAGGVDICNVPVPIRRIGIAE